jgi:hypothetical protein
MKDPRRLSSEDPISAALFGAARAYRPSVSLRRRTLKMLGLPIALSVAMSAPAVVASSISAAAKSWIAIAAVTATVAGGGGIAAYRAVSHERPPAPRIEEGRQRPRGPRPMRPAIVTLPPAEIAPSSPAPAAEPSPASGALPRMRVASAAPSAGTLGSLGSRRFDLHRPVVISSPGKRAELVSPPPFEPPTTAPLPPRRAALAPEIALLDEADRAIGHRDWASAFARLDEHARMFPDGALGEEASVLRIATAGGSGDVARAEALARDFVRRHGKSVLAERVTSMMVRMKKGK